MNLLARRARLVLAGVVLAALAIGCNPGGGASAPPLGQSAAPVVTSPSPAAPEPSSSGGKGDY